METIKSYRLDGESCRIRLFPETETETASAGMNLIDRETLERVAPILRNVAHPLCLRILDYLDQAGEPRNVTDIMAAVGVGQAVTSQQLRILKDQGVLTAHRDGNFIRYAIADRSVLLLLDCIRSHRACPPANDAYHDHYAGQIKLFFML